MEISKRMQMTSATANRDITLISTIKEASEIVWHPLYVIFMEVANKKWKSLPEYDILLAIPKRTSEEG
jgi:hypothetical protein